MKLIAAITLFFSLLLFLLGIFGRMSSKEKALDKLKAYDDKVEVVKTSRPIRKGPIGKIGNWMSKFQKDPNKRKKRNLIVTQADVPFTYEEFMIFRALFVILLTFLIFAVTKDFVMVLVVLVVSSILPKIYLKRKIKNNIAAFDALLNDGVVMISNALKAGYSFMQALAVAAEETQDPFKKSFKILLKELSLGMPLEDGLENLLERMPSDDLRLIVNAILIQRDVGGNLSEILENIAETIRERQKIKNELNTLTAQGKLSGMIIMAMPIFLGLIFYVLNKDYILVLFTTPIGNVMLGLAIFNQIIGWLFIRKIVNIEM
jgi:tight adherence protein B